MICFYFLSIPIPALVLIMLNETFVSSESRSHTNCFALSQEMCLEELMSRVDPFHWQPSVMDGDQGSTVDRRDDPMELIAFAQIVTQRDTRGRTALMTAAGAGSVGTLERLLVRHNSVSAKLTSMLHSIAGSNESRDDSSADSSSSIPPASTPRITADRSQIEGLIQSLSLLNQDTNGLTALHHAGNSSNENAGLTILD